MDKTILEKMYRVTQKMADPSVSGQILINAASKKKAGIELKALRQELGIERIRRILCFNIL